jgi:hypothetical protein
MLVSGTIHGQVPAADCAAAERRVRRLADNEADAEFLLQVLGLAPSPPPRKKRKTSR